MEARKLIQFGNSSHVISIPKAWIRENKLKKGDLVFVEKNSEGAIILFPKEKQTKKEEKRFMIVLDGKNNMTIKREIISAYLNNYNLITLAGKNIKDNGSYIRKSLDNLVGLEMIEQNSKQIIVKDILNITEVPLGEVIRRMDNTLRSMFLEVRELIEEKSKKKNKLVEIDQDINKLNFLIWKLLRKGLENNRISRDLDLDPKNVMTISVLVLNLEHIGDKLKYIAELMLNVNSNKRKKLVVLLQEIEKMYLESMKAFYKSDKQSAQNIFQNKKEFVKKCESLSRDVFTVRLSENFKHIQNLIYQIGKLTFDL